MSQTFKPYEIDHHTLKLIVGVIAITLGNLTSFFSSTPIESISASYHEGGLARDIFVGFLFAICAFLLAYNGASTLEMVLSKLAALSSVGVAVFPCNCGGREEIIPRVHGISAAAMFIILSVFCLIFYRRARAKHRREAEWRAYIYAACGLVIVSAILLLAIDYISSGSISSNVARLTFYCERAGLIAFGVSWLVASRVLPFITAKDERISLIVDAAPAVDPLK